MLVVFDLGMDLVEVGVGRVLPSRDLDRDKPLFREVVPQDVGRVRETLQNKKGNTCVNPCFQGYPGAELEESCVSLIPRPSCLKL